MRFGAAAVVRSANHFGVQGAIAESAIAHQAIKLGFDVYKPLNEGTRSDLILDVDRRLIRVQCKWASRHGDVIVVRAYSCRRSANGLVKRGYTAEEIDAYGVYCADIDSCYLLPIDEFRDRRAIQLRLRRRGTTSSSG
jgi:PD-(D/E)XK endonuclease